MSEPALAMSSFAGVRGNVATYHWSAEGPRYVAVIAHGYGEHAGRYGHLAAALVADGAVVYALDHHGHGQSEGDRALIRDVQDFIVDLDTLMTLARAEHPALPVVLIGHSMGGAIAARYAQLHADQLTGLVVSAPIVGGNPAFEALLGLDPIPEVPINPDALSRDPAVGAAYAADPLVYHGPFLRETLQSLISAVDTIASGGSLTMPTLWIHGDLDPLAPLEVTRGPIEHIGGTRLKEKIYPGAMHEVFNETNRDEVVADVIAFIATVV